MDLGPGSCRVIGLYDSHKSFEVITNLACKTPTPSKVLVDVDKIPHDSLCMRLTHHGSSSQRPPLDPLSSSLGLKLLVR